MTSWYTSDLHLGHTRIIELSGRPFADVDEMNRAIIRNWNEVVGPGDHVFVLGDIVMGRFAENVELVRQLQGTKWLVPGNHDRVHPAYRGMRSDLVPGWRAMYEAVGLHILHHTISRTVGGHLVTLCHFPWVGDDLGRDELDSYRPVDDGRWLLHGHVHERYQTTGRQINVGVDVWGYAPVSEHTLADLIDAG